MYNNRIIYQKVCSQTIRPENFCCSAEEVEIFRPRRLEQDKIEFGIETNQTLNQPENLSAVFSL